MTTRRGFFGAITGVAAAAAGMRTTPEPVDPMVQQLADLRRQAALLQEELARPKTVTIVLDARELARHVTERMPSELLRRGVGA